MIPQTYITLTLGMSSDRYIHWNEWRCKCVFHWHCNRCHSVHFELFWDITTCILFINQMITVNWQIPREYTRIGWLSTLNKQHV